MKNRAGYTLLEALVAIGAIAIVGTLIAQVFFTTTRTNKKAEVLKDVKQNGTFALDVMSRMIRNSHGVYPESLCDGTEKTAIEIQNPDGNNTVFECVYDGIADRIASISATTGSSEYLTSSNVTLGGVTCSSESTLKFTCTPNTDEPPTISISFSLSQQGSPQAAFEQGSIDFQTVVSPRN